MTDYKKLIDLLRTAAANVETDFAPSLHQTRQRAEVVNQAADAIEALSKYKELWRMARDEGFVFARKESKYYLIRMNELQTAWPPEGSSSVRVYPVENEKEAGE